MAEEIISDYYARMKPLPAVDADAFWPNVEKTATCWLWRGTLFRQGYGRYGSYKAHRIAWKLTHGGVPRGANSIVKISRRNSGGFLVLNKYNLRSIEEGKSPDPLIEAGDRIEVTRLM